VSTTLPEQAQRPERADAARNRELVLETARKLFAEQGIGVTLNDIAHEAGVGVGTVYRKFPDKDALLEALLSAKFAKLTALADEANAIVDPREALRHYLFRAMELRASDRALADVIVRAAKSRPAVIRDRAHLDAVVTGLVLRARDAGVLREGFEGRDVAILTVMIGTVADRTKECGADIWRRYAQILVDGVCPPLVSEPLPGEALDQQALERALQH
jgi:AcrR family transcriptional regulator